MNKIILDNKEVIDIDKSINFTDKNNTYKFDILSDTSLLIEANDIQNKTLEFNLKDNVNLNLYIIKKGIIKDITEKYILNNSNLNINKFNDTLSCNELIEIDLNKSLGNCNYNFKTISKNKEEYILNINHNSKETKANIKNNGINIEKGKLSFNISCYIKKDMIKCESSQNNRIVNLTNNKCSILPNLYIDENDVIASHSAHIGTFREEDLFYLQSRGIDIEEAKRLLIRGYLLSNIDENISNQVNEIINKYWR